jgi:hypothetical protein
LTNRYQLEGIKGSKPFEFANCSKKERTFEPSFSVQYPMGARVLVDVVRANAFWVYSEIKFEWKGESKRGEERRGEERR